MRTVATIWGSGYYAENYGNENLKWEETEAWNGRTRQFNLFGNRVELIIDGYYKTQIIC